MLYGGFLVRSRLVGKFAKGRLIIAELECQSSLALGPLQHRISVLPEFAVDKCRLESWLTCWQIRVHQRIFGPCTSSTQHTERVENRTVIILLSNVGCIVGATIPSC